MKKYQTSRSATGLDRRRLKGEARGIKRYRGCDSQAQVLAAETLAASQARADARAKALSGMTYKG